MKALFLDRDGVINHDTGHVHRIADFVFIDGIFALGREAMEKGFAIIVVTNQAGIGRGYYTEADFHALAAWMCGRFAAEGVTIADVFFAPHHPEEGIGIYKADTIDRKPGPGMILKAAARHGLDPAASVMLGDRATDMQAGAAADVGRLVLVGGDAGEAARSPRGIERYDSVAAFVGRL